MERIDVRELQEHAFRYLSLVEEGQSFEVSEGGTVVALLVPPTRSQSGRKPTNQELLDEQRAERL